ncbi:MAG: hypothetical protein E7447_04035 [Ruminococcaceae bacterium]|nr:hypothetical protein [Oscillospiraceae bacterium]
MRNSMKRLIAIMMLLAMGIGLISGVPFSAMQASAAEPETDVDGNPIVNLMEHLNPDFEEMSIPGWSVMTGVSQSDEQLYGEGGLWSLKLSDSSAASAVWSMSDKNEIKAGEDYTISAQVYGGIGQMTVYFYDSEGKELEDLTISLETKAAANEWQTLSKAFFAEPGVTHFAVKVSTTVAGKEAVYFDAVMLEKKQVEGFALYLPNGDFNDVWTKPNAAPFWSGTNVERLEEGKDGAAVGIKRTGGGYNFKSDKFAVLPGKAYTATIDIKQTKDMRGQFYIQFFADENGSAIKSAFLNFNSKTSGDWVTLAVNGIAPANARFAHILITSPWGAGTAAAPEYTYFDNATVSFADELFDSSFEGSGIMEDGTPTNISVARDVADALSNKDAHTGFQSLLGNTGSWWYTHYINVKPGEVYEFSAFAKGQNALASGSTCGILLYFYDENGALIKNSSQGNFQPNFNGWTEMKVSYKAPDNAVAARGMVYKANGNGRVFFDDFRLTQTTDYNLGVNYMTNGGFEQRKSANNTPIDKWLASGTPNIDMFAVEYLGGDNGYAGRIFNTTYVQTWTEPIPVTPGKIYSFTIDGMGEGRIQAYIRYYTSAEAKRGDFMTDGEGKDLGMFNTTANLKANDWRELQVSGSVAPEGATHARIWICGLTDQFTGKIDLLMDNALFMEGIPKVNIPGESGVVWNPGFEEINKGSNLPEYWGTWGTMSLSVVDAKESPDDVYEGRYALKISVPETMSGTHGAICDPFPVEEGSTYRFSMYVKEDYDKGRGFQTYIGYFDASGNRLAAFYTTTPATGEWNYHDVSGAAPDGSVYARVYMVSGAGKGNVCFDKLNFVKEGGADLAPVEFDGEWDIVYDEYPRLDFDKDGLERIKKFTKSKSVCAYGYAGTVTLKSLLKKADAYLEETKMSIAHKGITLEYELYPVLKDMTTRKEFETAPEGFEVYPYMTAVGQRLVDRVQTLSLAYAITGDVKYGERAKQYALDICNFEWWVGYWNDIVNGTGEKSSQTTGYMVDCVIAAYDMCHDLFTKEELSKMEAALIEKGLEAMYNDCWARMQRNRDMDHATGLILISCVIMREDNIDLLKKYLDLGMSYINWRLNFMYKSGVNEGHMYDSLAIDDIVITLATLERVTGYKGPMDHPFMEELKTLVLGFFDPVNGELPAYSDSDFASHYYPYSMAVFSQQGNELATYYLAVGGGLSSDYDRLVWHTDVSLAELETPDEREGNVNFVECQGFGSLRTGWGILDSMLVVAANGSEQEHNHYDQNSILLAFNGLWMLSDSEYKDNSYSDLTTYQMKYTNTTIFVDGKPQVRKGQGTLDLVFDTHIYGYLLGSAPNAYGMEDKQAVLNKFDRHIIMLNHDSKPYYIIFDDLDSNKERNFGWNFYTAGWDRIEIDGNNVEDGSSATGNRLTLSRFGSTLHSYFVGSQVTSKENYYAGYGPALLLESEKAKNYQFMNVLSVEKGSGSQISTLFEHLMEAQSSTVEESIEEGKISWSTSRSDTTKNSILSVTIGSRLVMFRAGLPGDWISFPFEVPETKEYGVTIDIGQTMEYDGTWDLYLDDQLITTYKPNGPLGVATVDAGQMTLEAGQHTVKIVLVDTPATAFGGTICSVGGITLDTGESMGEGTVKVVEEYNSGDLLGATITYGPVLKDVVLFNRGTNSISGGGLTTNGQQASVIGINGKEIAEGYAVTKGTSLKYGDQILVSAGSPVSIAMDYTFAKYPVKNDLTENPVEIHEDFDIDVPIYYVSASAAQATEVSLNVGVHAPYTVYVGEQVIASSHSGEMLTFTLPEGDNQITIIGTHQHVFDQHSTNILNIKEWAGCGHNNVYYVSCVCGENGTETFSDGEVKGHNLKAIKGIEATDTQDGRLAHWQCSKCKKLFADAAGTKEISAADVFIMNTSAQAQQRTIILIVSIVAGVVILGGGAVAFVLIRKKKNSDQTPIE